MIKKEIGFSDKKVKGVALLESIILIISIVAFAHLLGSQFGFVSADGENFNPSYTPTAGNPSGTPTPPSPGAASAGSGAGLPCSPDVATPGCIPVGGSGSSGGAGGNSANFGVSGVLQMVGIAGAIAGVAALVASLFGSPEASKAASLGSFAGAMAFQLIRHFAKDLGLGLTLGAAFGIGIIVFFIFFTQTKYELVKFACVPWDAPTGGKDCQKCNEMDLPCSEYRCKALGQACDLVNPGTTEELCVWVNPGDVRPPVIEAWEDVLTDGYEYSPNNAISPPDRGVKIVPETDSNGCVEAFTPLKFGVTLDEPAKCKIDALNKPGFDEMSLWFGGSSISRYNHTQAMSLPSPSSLAGQNLTLQNGGDFDLFVRCQDANGNANTANFVFHFCVNKGPDTTPPLVVSTSIINGAPIAFNQNSTNLNVYVNEPAECRWSRSDQDYNNMENQMSCETNVLNGIEINTQLVYQCATTLTGLKNEQNNDFYFRCKDQPELANTPEESNRNVNTQSYKFTLVGTRPLAIISTEPNGTVRDSSSLIKATLKAETIGGYKNGESICAYSQTGAEGSFIDFFNTGKNKHSQDLFLAEGSYTFYVRCIDLGGNADNKIITFDTESDNEAPVVVRIYKEENFLKIITNEKASCVYSISTENACNYLFEDGIAMQSLENNKHQIEWDVERTFYIKCADEFGNQPLPNECSIIARPFGE